MQTVTRQNFEAEVLNSSVPVLVDFFATWCPPCRMIAPTLDSVAAEFAGRARIVKVNVDDSPDLAGRYRIQGVPSLLFFLDGEEVGRIVGAASLQALRRALNELLTAGVRAG